MYLQEGIYDRFQKKLADRMKNWVVGDPFDPRVNQGPQVLAEINLAWAHPLFFVQHEISIVELEPDRKSVV